MSISDQPPQQVQPPKGLRDDQHAHLELDLRIHDVSTLRRNPSLAEQIRAFANEGYKYMAAEIKPRWEYFYGDRLPSPESLFDVLGEDGMFAVLYHCGTEAGEVAGRGEEFTGKPVACAATKRWVGDLEGRKSTTIRRGEDEEMVGIEHEEEEDKEGWEILCVTTHVEYMKRGYAGRCIDALLSELQRRERSSRANGTWNAGACEDGGEDGGELGGVHQRSDRGGDGENSEKLIIWTQAIEELNGRFWRNRGWKEVRRHSKPVGSWGSRFGYDLLVLVKEVGV